MPGLSFGLKASKPSSTLPRPPPKRKAFFDSEEQPSDDETSTFPSQTTSKKPSRPLRPLSPLPASVESDEDSPRPSKSPKLSHNSTPATDQYTNLAALRNAKIQDAKVASVDASVYDYDAAYDTFSAPTKQKPVNGEASGPKYMGNLLASSEQRKRDLLKAKEKQLQREREQEGDEFADKEKFVTSGYKKQQEEMRIQEEEEKKRLEMEEEKRRQGVGMTDFNKTLLRRDEERQKAIEEATKRKDDGVEVEMGVPVDDEDESKMARDLNAKGGHIIVNEEGEVVDKRQLLSAGLNTAPMKPTLSTTQASAKPIQREDYSKSSTARNAREAQRERQSRMMERQLEEMTEKARAEEEAVEKEREDKNKSKITEDVKMDAKARYLARKKEREEEAKKAKA